MPIEKNKNNNNNIHNKIIFFQNIIQSTSLYIKQNKATHILNMSDVNNCMDILSNINNKVIDLINKNITNNDEIVNTLQTINNDLSCLIKIYGTTHLEDLLRICFGTDNLIKNENEIHKYELLNKFFHPISYKVITNKSEPFNNNSEITIVKLNNLDCFDIPINIKQFHLKINGIQLYVHNSSSNKSILINGFVDDVVLDFLNNEYILFKRKQILQNLPNEPMFKRTSFNNFVSSLTLKDYLIHTYTEIYNKYIGYLTQLNILKQKPISQIVKEFITNDLFSKRLTLIQLLITSDNYENQYLAYLLYDILSNDTTSTNIDTHEQTILFNNFSWSLQKYFRHAMKNTIKYTNKLSNFDIHQIPLEQQICLLNTTDIIKEKAMLKLKEVKAKSEDSGSKARQYLDALLRIPFNIYKKEPILNLMVNIQHNFYNIKKFYNLDIQLKTKYTSIEILKYINQLECTLNEKSVLFENTNNLQNIITNCEKTKLINNVIILNNFIIINNINYNTIKYSNKNKNELNKLIHNVIEHIKITTPNLLKNIYDLFNETPNKNNEIIKLKSNLNEIKEYICNIKCILDKSVHGHDDAKKQIERIICQWINGEQDGHCFGFEGPPGVGKTSLAKMGISNCLKDENGINRPFAMIQIGGDSNGSTLQGHNYTYVGSTWGSIVQILIDKKCMNPIIFIDEIDKISKTESGKEIIGILTHLLDTTQNDCFQDKYFTGINLDLSKVLFILSYNDSNAIDKILLDRVHRIKFSNLSLEDKIIISKTFILPDICIKMGLEDVIYFNDNVIKFIIEEYTCEPGVRKLKEIFFEIIGEININLLKDDYINITLPINITRQDITNNYFKNKDEIHHKKIHNESKIGTINGLWANSVGKGGTLPIQAKFFPSDNFLNLKLTGSQGDIMKESMNVALTMAWDLTDDSIKDYIRNKYKDYGVHIHCPDCSTPKDGPSALSTITIVIYSIFNSKKIKNYIGITGEMTMDGDITEIGGLELKILGGINAGIKEFIFPNENIKDYNKFINKYKDTELVRGILFHPVNNIYEIIKIIFE